MREAVAGDGRDELEAGPDGTLGVVLLRDRCAPDRHDGVADELLDDPAVAGDDGTGEVEVAREELSHLLGVVPLRERREADEIAEQDRDVAQLGRPRPAWSGRRGPGDRRPNLGHGVEPAPAHPAERLARRRERAAGRTRPGHGRAAVLTEEAVDRELGPTRRAAHPRILPRRPPRCER